jgi:DNA repair protein RadC
LSDRLDILAILLRSTGQSLFDFANFAVACPSHPHRVMRFGPREKLARLGPGALADAELLAVVLGCGTKGRPALAVANELCARGLRTVAHLRPEEMAAVSGVGPARALRLTAAFQLGHRAVLAKRQAVPIIAGPEDVHRRLQPLAVGLPQEVFWVLGLDARNQLVTQNEVARGTLTGVEVHPRDVFRPLLRSSSAAAVVAHNHPSGDPTPSPEDRALTARLRAAGEIVGIPVVDHIIIGNGRYTSLAEEELPTTFSVNEA